jgi:hypothetical protein
MAAGRTQGPIREVPLSNLQTDQSDFNSPAAGFFRHRPIGSDAELDTTGSGGCGNAEITVIAKFDNPWNDEKVELAQIKAGKWNPGTADFDEIAKHEKHPIQLADSFFTFLGAIQNAGGTKKRHIKRLNVVTHATSGLVAFSGTIDASTGDVSMKNSGQWNDPEKGLDTAALNALFDPTLAAFLAELREKFCENAEIVFYACNSGQALNKLLLDDVADTFLVKTGGFDDRLWYLPTKTIPIDRNFTAFGPAPPSAPPSNPKRGFKHSESNIKWSVPKKKASATP